MFEQLGPGHTRGWWEVEEGRKPRSLFLPAHSITPWRVSKPRLSRWPKPLFSEGKIKEWRGIEVPMEVVALEFEWRSMGSGERNLEITEPNSSILCRLDPSKISKLWQQGSTFVKHGSTSSYYSCIHSFIQQTFLSAKIYVLWKYFSNKQLEGVPFASSFDLIFLFHFSTFPLNSLHQVLKCSSKNFVQWIISRLLSLEHLWSNSSPWFSPVVIVFSVQ